MQFPANPTRNPGTRRGASWRLEGYSMKEKGVLGRRPIPRQPGRFGAIELPLDYAFVPFSCLNLTLRQVKSGDYSPTPIEAEPPKNVTTLRSSRPRQPGWRSSRPET